MNEPTARPSRDDPVLRAASEWIGGPVGQRATFRRRWWTPVRIALAVASLALALGFIADQPCRSGGWADRADQSMWKSMCYSDVAFLYRERGFADDQIAYRDNALEYPVLTGAVMQATVFVADAVDVVIDDGADDAVTESTRFFDVTAVLMALCALVAVAATALTVPRRPWDGLLVAASPLLLLSATINWDLLAVALAATAILAWTRERPVLSGVLVGLGTAAKLYPVLLLGPMFLVALRAPDRRAALGRFGATAATAAVTWGAVNLPIAWWAPDGWRAFFDFNADRPADFGSIWYALNLLEPGLLPDDVGTYAVVGGLISLVVVVGLALAAPEPPRLAQLAFLAVAAFLLINKVWSPQYSLWLLPLAVLARPRIRDLAIWQAVEVAYFVGVWWYLASLFAPDDAIISDRTYALVTVLRVAAVLWFAAMVVRDMFRPEGDPVRPFVVARVPDPLRASDPPRAGTAT